MDGSGQTFWVIIKIPKPIYDMRDLLFIIYPDLYLNCLRYPFVPLLCAPQHTLCYTADLQTNDSVVFPDVLL